LRLARALKQQGVQNIYFVCPQFWAWRPWRANLVRRRFVRGLCIFPFEQDWYRARGVTADFIGHPLVGNVAAKNRVRSSRHFSDWMPPNQSSPFAGKPRGRNRAPHATSRAILPSN